MGSFFIRDLTRIFSEKMGIGSGSYEDAFKSSNTSAQAIWTEKALSRNDTSPDAMKAYKWYNEWAPKQEYKNQDEVNQISDRMTQAAKYLAVWNAPGQTTQGNGRFANAQIQQAAATGAGFNRTLLAGQAEPNPAKKTSLIGS